MTIQLEAFHPNEPLSASKKNKQVDKFNELAGLGVRPPMQVFTEAGSPPQATNDITGFWTVRRFSQGTTSGPHILAAIDPIAGRDSMTQNMTLGNAELIAVGGSSGVVFVLNVVSTRTEDITGYTVLDAVTLAPIGDRVELPGRTFWKSIDGDASTVLVARSVTIFVNNNEVVPKSGSNSITDIAGISGDGVTSWIVNQDRLYFMRTEDMKAAASIDINDDTVNSATAAGGQTVKSFEVLDVAGKGLTCSVLMRLTFPDLVEPGSSGQPVPTLYYYLFHHGLVDGQVKLTGHTYLGSRNRYLSIGGGE